MSEQLSARDWLDLGLRVLARHGFAALKAESYDGWAIVEQDMYPAPFDKPLPIARRTRAYLQSIGIDRAPVAAHT